MKIIYIAPQPIPSKFANSIHVMKMAQALGRLGHDVTLFFQKSAGAPENIYKLYDVEPVFTLVSSLPGAIPYAFHNVTRAWLAKPDLVFSRNLLSAWLCAKISLKVLFEIHDSPGALKPLAQKFFRGLARMKNVNFVVISQALADHVRKDHGITGQKIVLAPDAADPLPVSTAAPPFEKPPGSFHAGYTGHLYKGRGIELISAMAFALPAVTFHIVGGTAEDIAWWQHKLAGLPNLQFPGYIPHAQVGNYLQHFDVLLAPYQQQVAVGGNQGDTGRWMSPLKIFEYMAAGKPLICSDLPVLREVLNEQNALLCPPDNASAWNEALSFLQKNPGDAARLGQTALTDFNARHSWLKRAETIISFVNVHGR
jgi:glycosyltransferase involved in cell wall biosynthesis